MNNARSFCAKLAIELGALRPARCGAFLPAAVIGIRQMFGYERRTAIKQRAKLMGRMVMLLTDGLCTKLSQCAHIAICDALHADLLVGDFWYESPDWKPHRIRTGPDYGDGAHV